MNAAARHVRQEGDRLGDFVQALQRSRRPDAALAGFDDDDQAVGAEQVTAILVERLGIFVAQRKLLLEPGIHAQLDGEAGHDDGEENQEPQHETPVTEQRIFQRMKNS